LLQTWSDETFDFVKAVLKAGDFRYDGYVILFCVTNDAKDADVDFDEVAWELEKCLVTNKSGGQGGNLGPSSPPFWVSDPLCLSSLLGPSLFTLFLVLHLVNRHLLAPGNGL
jgi:hypothetical protein